MPTYDYVCASCGHRFEIFERMSVRGRRECPACGKRKGERAIGIGAGLIFKGNGFYATEYRNGSKPAEKTAGSGEAPQKSPASDSKKAT